MSNKTVGWVLGLAAIGVMLVTLGTEISGFDSWARIVEPKFIGKAILDLGTTIGAFVGGKLIPSTGTNG